MTSQLDPAVQVPPAAGTKRKFPTVPYGSGASYFEAYMDEMTQAWGTTDLAAFDRAAAMLTEGYLRGARVFSCGNGGSASIANHLVCDHTKGVRTKTDLLPRVESLSNNIELLTAIANDVAYEDVFAFQLESRASAGDVLVAISPEVRNAVPSPLPPHLYWNVDSISLASPGQGRRN